MRGSAAGTNPCFVLVLVLSEAVLVIGIDADYAHQHDGTLANGMFPGRSGHSHALRLSRSSETCLESVQGDTNGRELYEAAELGQIIHAKNGFS